MSYARSKRSVIKVENILKQLLEAKDDLIFQSLEPQKLAYHIHEGMRSVAFYPEYSLYTQLRDKFVIRVRSNKVVAELRNKTIVALATVSEQLGKMTIVDVDNVMSVIGACVKHKAGEIYFPAAQFNDTMLNELYQWSEPAGYFIINHGVMGITLTRVHPGEINFVPKVKENGNVQNS